MQVLSTKIIADRRHFDLENTQKLVLHEKLNVKLHYVFNYIFNSATFILYHAAIMFYMLRAEYKKYNLK